MVELSFHLDSIFTSLADPTRRDILRRIAHEELSVGEVASSYNLTFAAVSKHLKILENAKLIVKRRHGKKQLVHASPAAFKIAGEYLRHYETLWNTRLGSLENYTKKK